MRRVIVPALLAIALVACTSANASAFGLFDHLCNKGCDSGCAEPVCGCEVVEPACGCEAPAPCCEIAEPVCGCEVIEPACGCEPACDSGCCGSKKPFGLLKKLFSCHKSSCDAGCCEVAEPVCGCEVIEPACGCEPACDTGCCGPKKPFGLFSKLFNCNKSSCDSGCCEVIEPTCGCEPACGVEAPCGCH